MSLDELEALPEELQALLREGRPGAEPPAGAREATLSFVAAHGLAAGAGAAAAAHGAALGTAGTGGTSALRALGSLKASFGVGGIVLGAALGAGGHAAYIANREAHAPLVAAAAAASAPTTTAVATAVTASNETHNDTAWSATPSVAPSVSVPVGRPPAEAAATGASTSGRTDEANANVGRDNLLAAERNLIDTARTAVARRDGDAALTTLERHTREFPHGRLAEEREWLTIQALVLSSRREEARARAAAFRSSFPRSLMLPALDQVVGP